MPKFLEMRDKLVAHFEEMRKESKCLFEVHLDKEALWNLYLDSFPENENQIYRVRRYHDCSCCKHFIRTIGNVVMIKDGKLTSIWDFKVDSNYQQVLDKLSEFVKSHPILDKYVVNEKKIGTSHNFEKLEDGIKQWDHFYVELPESFIHRDRTKTINQARSEYKDTKMVFKRALDEITVDSITTVLDLIDSNILYRGTEWKEKISKFLNYKQTYEMYIHDDKLKDLFAWEQTMNAGMEVGRIGNSVIGTLLYDISEGEDLEKAVKKYEAKVAPENYRRSKPIFTQRMLDAAKDKITELGYLDSLGRRYATIDDININDILFANRNESSMTQALDVFAEMSKDVTINPKRFNNATEIGIEDFIKDVLPNATSVEAYVENKHTTNMVSLIAPQVADSKTMFKWGNNFSWAYEGNVTDSLMKERVKAAGGKVDGDLRCSIQWNDLDEHSRNDLDLHCYEIYSNSMTRPQHIYFGSYCKSTCANSFSPTKGQLDVDIRHPLPGIPAVENITWASRKTMKPGKYLFLVDDYEYRGGNDGFRAEIEFDDKIYSFDYRDKILTDQKVDIAEVTLDEDGNFSIKTFLPTTDEKVSSKRVWGLNTHQFVPVTAVMLSPNYWNNTNGNKHYFFMLKDCKNPGQPNGFYNEFLKNELLEHRKVFEALGTKMKVNYADNQLSGIGFSSTKRNDLVVKVKQVDNTEKVLRIKF